MSKIRLFGRKYQYMKCGSQKKKIFFPLLGLTTLFFCGSNLLTAAGEQPVALPANLGR